MIQETGECILKHINVRKNILNRIQVEQQLSKIYIYIYIHNVMKLKTKNLYNKRAHCSNEDAVHKMRKIFIYFIFENYIYFIMQRSKKLNMIKYHN